LLKYYTIANNNRKRFGNFGPFQYNKNYTANIELKDSKRE